MTKKKIALLAGLSAVVVALVVGLVGTVGAGSSGDPDLATPEKTLEGFYAQSWDKGQTADEYVNDVKKFVTKDSIPAAKESLAELEKTGGKTIALSYSDVKISSVKINGDTATAKVQYTITAEANGNKQSAKNQNVEHVLTKVDGNWLIG